MEKMREFGKNMEPPIKWLASDEISELVPIETHFVHTEAYQTIVRAASVIFALKGISWTVMVSSPGEALPLKKQG